MKASDKYFKVISTEDGTEADILLYGVIGQDFWWDEELNKESITDLAFVKTMKELEAKYDRINIRINSPGGSMYHGNAIVTAIQTSKAEVHVYNDGMAASMAADIWLSAPHRHMAKNSLLMIHSPSSWVVGTAKEMREEADILDKFEHTAIAVMADTTSLSEEEIKKQFYDYKDHWLTAKEVEEMNLISKVEDYETEGLPTDIEKMSFQDVMKYFEEKGDGPDKSFLDNLKEKWTAMFSRRMSTSIHIPTKEDPFDMKNIDDIIKEVEEGNLNKVDLLERLGAVEAPKKKDTPADPPAAPATGSGATAPTLTLEALNAAIEKAVYGGSSKSEYR